MDLHRPATMLATVLVVSLAAPAATVLGADPPTTLRFAVVGGEDHPMARYARAFIDEASDRSAGSLVLDPVWGAGEGLTPPYEQGVAVLLADGGADVALVASRAWDAAGVSSLQALHAPLLIDDMRLAAAVAADELAAGLLADMAGAGVTGLALWPEDLEHPVAFPDCVDPIVRPEQLRGLTVRDVAAASMDEIITALGATPVFANDYGHLVLTCEIDAAEAGFRRAPAILPGPAPITGDITLSPRFAVLAGNLTSLERLTPGQRVALVDAALAARDLALAELVDEGDAAAAWCNLGGQVVLAGEAGRAAFADALRPITDRLLADPTAGPAIAAIETLKADTDPGPPVQACGAASGPMSVPTPAATFALRSTDGYAGTIPPDGAYRADITTEDLLAAGASALFAQGNAGVFTLAISKGVTSWDDGSGPPCAGTITSDGTSFSIHEDVPDTCVGGRFVWREADGGIALLWLPVTDGSWPVVDVNDVSAYFDRVWMRVD